MTEYSIAALRELAAEVATNTSLMDVRVSSVSAQCGMDDMDDGEATVNAELSTRAQQTKSGDRIRAWSRYRVTALLDGQDEPFWSVDAEIVSEFAIISPQAYTKDASNAFSLVVGAMTNHPYARELVQSCVARMGFPPFSLGTLRSPLNGDAEEMFDLSSDEDSPF